MSDSSLYNAGRYGDGDSTENLWVLIGVLGTALGACVLPTVGGPVVVAGITVMTELNVRTPDPWDRGSESWNEVSDLFAQIKNRATRLSADVDGLWADRGAEAFKSFMAGHIEPALQALSTAATAMRNMCDSMWWSLLTVLAGYLTFTATAIIACASAYAAGPYAPAVQWTIIGAWAGAAIAAIGVFISFAQGLWASGQSVNDAFSELSNMFEEKAGRLNTETLALPQQLRVRIAEPTNWAKE
ncbi:hypothetical protein [Micromonospora sp. KC213]|uniref:hypothetical protein n=1 Tax=Micromonospora sp. KC213 TaxID=2530378 RepID=UPI0010512268|nr:hypothetical protein [Micromonospora sp. KC213]TDC41410.1 hypothetical protein E1166_11850 [Micromonospora sp. KC213]